MSKIQNKSSENNRKFQPNYILISLLLWLIISTGYISWNECKVEIGQSCPHSEEIKEQNYTRFKDIGTIIFIPLSLISLIIGSIRNQNSLDRDRHKISNSIVTQFLSDVYNIRTSIDFSIYADITRTEFEHLKFNEKAHINHILNLIEQICIAINEELVDEDMVIKNCISIIVKYHYILSNYIYFFNKLDQNNIKKDAMYEHLNNYSAWGISSQKINNWKNSQNQQLREHVHGIVSSLAVP